MMSNFTPDGHILCENCYKFFVAYQVLQTEIDADRRDAQTRNAYNGIVNRIRCPFCNTEFNYAASLYIHSHTDKFVITSRYPAELTEVTNFPLAVKIAGMQDWRMRKCNYAMDACEKIRIFKSGLNDARIMILKLKCFENYINMDLDDEYIAYESICGRELLFTHRDFTDKIKNIYRVDMAQYDKIPDICIESGIWHTIDREWAINKLEEIS